MATFPLAEPPPITATDAEVQAWVDAHAAQGPFSALIAIRKSLIASARQSGLTDHADAQQAKLDNGDYLREWIARRADREAA